MSAPRPTESLRSRFRRWMFNCLPAYRATGAWITYLSADWLEAHIRLPLNWRTRNLHGTIYGGCLYAAVDPLHAGILLHNLGPAYVVWTKRAEVFFRRQGRETLTAKVAVSREELDAIRETLRHQPKLDRHYTVELRDRGGQVCTEVRITVHIRRRAVDGPSRHPSDPVAARPAAHAAINELAK